MRRLSVNAPQVAAIIVNMNMKNGIRTCHHDQSILWVSFNVISVVWTLTIIFPTVYFIINSFREVMFCIIITDNDLFIYALEVRNTGCSYIRLCLMDWGLSLLESGAEVPYRRRILLHYRSRSQRMQISIDFPIVFLRNHPDSLDSCSTVGEVSPSFGMNGHSSGRWIDNIKSQLHSSISSGGTTLIRWGY